MGDELARKMRAYRTQDACVPEFDKGNFHGAPSINSAYV
jgi:hypothetical protein